MPSGFGTVFPHQLRHPNTVERKNRRPPFGLRRLMKDVLLPAADGLFIPPPGKGQDFAVGRQALEPFDIDKAVDTASKGLSSAAS